MALTIGSPAPELRVSTWVQGGPIAGFEPGHIYVVEFWSTWCGPCKATIPHLSKLAKRFDGAITVIGVDIWEQEDTSTPEGLAKIKNFVASMGDRMTYPVATDKDGYMSEAWMRQSGRQGIPSSFVVDGSGTVVWMGHPAQGLDGVLAQLVGGKFDLDASRKQLAEEEERAAPMQKFQQMMKPFQEALKRKDYAAAIDSAEAIEQEMPSNKGLKLLRMQAGFECGHEEDALAITRQIIDDPESQDLFGPLGMTIAQLPDPPESAIRAGIFALEKVVGAEEQVPMGFFWLYALAILQAYTDTQLALATCRQAIQECRKAGEHGANFLPMLQEMEAKLLES